MVLRKTVHSEIPELTRISKAAFDTDNLVGNPETGEMIGDCGITIAQWNRAKEMLP